MRGLDPGLRFVIASLAVIMVGLASSAIHAQTAGTDGGGKRQRDAVHFTDALRPDDPKLTDTMEGAVASLRAGHEVVILFDGRSVTVLRMNAKKANKTPLEEIDIPRADRSGWAERLGLPPAQAPRNHFELVQRLVAAGAQAYVNQNAMRLYGLADEEIHPLARAISAQQMGQLLDETGLCYTYGH